MARRPKKQGGGKGPAPERAKGRATRLRPSAPPPATGPLVVALGASAGGLDAFKAFLANMPAKSGMALVLIQHLDPHHKSLLVELLSKQTEMPVVQAENGMAVAADRVFIIPPNAVLTIERGILRVATPAPPREQRRPIDTFFASLAADQKEKAVCVILSGSGSDGSHGLRVIKEHGGFSLAQAGFDETALLGMPSSAAATGLVDEVIPVEQMPARLIAYAQHLGKVDGRKAPDGTLRDAEEHLAKICALLRTRLGHDFSEYKPNTLIRRIQRRMQVLHIESVPEYIERLRREPAQLELLFHDLLIGVTRFFRDPEAFAALEREVIPNLFEKGGEIRIWVPGCATGEEAYSIAMLVKEAMVKREIAAKVQIFATDLDEQAIAIARHGRYRKMLAGVSPQRLNRWFVEEGDNYCVIKDIREMCVYSMHNAAKDPPFSRLDLISCRNLLIYLDTPLQNRLIRAFHYALRESGYLFLGTSEGVAHHGEFFTVLDKKYRIFQRRDDVGRSLPVGLSGAAHPPHPDQSALPLAPNVGDAVDQRARHALEKYSPAYLVVNRQLEVLRFSGRTGHFVEHARGAASLSLLKIVRKDLLPTVRAAVQEAIGTRVPVVREDIVVAANGHSRMLTLIVEPISEPDADLYVVAFQDQRPVSRETRAGKSDDTGRVHALEKELGATRLQLQAAIDDLETANEELKSSNEEYQSVNEELQSANEELESSQEELQSLNEELNTINAELSDKNQALAEANSDLKNLLDSTQIATLFLDVELRIRNFTPAMAEIFPLREHDHGRPVADIATHLSYTDLTRDAKRVLRSLSPVEREVAVPQGATFLMRILPYRTVSDVIGGVVITFTDISERKRHEEERARLAAIVGSSQDAIIGHSLEGTITSWNAGAERMFGYAAKEAVGKPLSILIPEHQPDPMPEILERFARGERTEHFEIGRITKAGDRIDISMTVSPIRDSGGALVGASTVARDVSERRRYEEERARLAAIVEASDDAIISMDLGGNIVTWNRGAEQLFGYSASEAVGKPITILYPPDGLAEAAEVLARVRRGERVEHYETKRRRKDGSVFDISFTISPVRDSEGRIVGASKIAQDVGERKHADDLRALMVDELNHRVKNT